MAIVRWLAFLLLLGPACAGVVFALIFAGMSVMGFDAPGSDRQMLPYVLFFGAWAVWLLAVFLVLYGIISMVAGRVRTACLCVMPPAVLAGAFVLWLRHV